MDHLEGMKLISAAFEEVSQATAYDRPSLLRHRAQPSARGSRGGFIATPRVQTTGRAVLDSAPARKSVRIVCFFCSGAVLRCPRRVWVLVVGGGTSNEPADEGVLRTFCCGVREDVRGTHGALLIIDVFLLDFIVHIRIVYPYRHYTVYPQFSPTKRYPASLSLTWELYRIVPQD